MPEFPGTLKPPRLPNAPTAPSNGQMYFDTGLSKLRWWNGSAWVNAEGGIVTINDSNLPPRLASLTNLNAITDLNVVNVTGWGYAVNGTNAPVGGWLHVFTLVFSTNAESRQWAYTLGGNNNIWMRNRSDTGVWAPWVQIFPVSDAILPQRIQEQGQYLASGSLNAITANGWYRFDVNVTDGPVVSMYGLMDVRSWVSGTVTWAYQWVKNLTGDQVWSRWNNNGTWGAWVSLVPVGDTSLPSRLQSGSFISASVTDVNNAVQSGWYNAGPGTTNNPDGNHYHIEVIAGSSGYVRQFAHWLYGPMFWTRAGGVGAWQPWTQIFPVGDASLPPRLGGVATNLITDCNAFNTNGWGYSQAGNCANTPYGAAAASGPWGIIESVTMNTPGNAIQRFYQYGTDNVYQRRSWDGAWHAWQQIYPVVGGMVLIQSGNSEGVSIVDIVGIPQTFNGLLIQATIGCPYPDNTQSLGCRINGFAGADYMWQFTYAQATVVSAADQGGGKDTSAFVGYMNGNWSYGAWEMTIPDYRNTYASGGYSRSQYMQSAGSGGFPLQNIAWNCTNHGGSQAINRLTFIRRDGGLFSMQNWRLYGLA